MVLKMMPTDAAVYPILLVSRCGCEGHHDSHNTHDLAGLHKGNLEARALGTACFPSLLKVKHLLLCEDALKTLDPKQLAHAAPLITWRAAPPEMVTQAEQNRLNQLDTFFAKHPAADIIRQAMSSTKWITETISIYDSGRAVKEWAFPLDDQSAFESGLLDQFIHNICSVLSDLHAVPRAQFPGEIVRLPLSCIRVRDIVFFRHLKPALESAGLSYVRVMTDNMLGLDRQETVEEPILALCASCHADSFDHPRCTRCKVSTIRSQCPWQVGK